MKIHEQTIRLIEIIIAYMIAMDDEVYERLIK